MKELHDPLNTPLPYQTLGYEINCQVMKAEIRGWGPSEELGGACILLVGECGGLPCHHAGTIGLRPYCRLGDVPPTNHTALPAGKVRPLCWEVSLWVHCLATHRGNSVSQEPGLALPHAASLSTGLALWSILGTRG